MLVVTPQRLDSATVGGVIEAQQENTWNRMNNSGLYGVDVWLFDHPAIPTTNLGEVPLANLLVDQAASRRNDPDNSSLDEDRNVRSWIIILLIVTMGFLTKVKPAISLMVEAAWWRTFGPLDDY